MQKDTIQVPGYEILSIVGEGRSSIVWAARASEDAPPVALKWLRTDEVPDESFRCRAMEEARASSRLHHPGIVDLKDVGEVDGGLYYVMEFVDGCTLAELLARKGRLQPKHAMQIAEAGTTRRRPVPSNRSGSAARRGAGRRRSGIRPGCCRKAARPRPAGGRPGSPPRAGRRRSGGSGRRQSPGWRPCRPAGTPPPGRAPRCSATNPRPRRSFSGGPGWRPPPRRRR
ncbi:MAG: protein kinase [Kiritimatiellae bacterium]|nr:protein kinase [Kiritimatiellia bacterium]